LAFSLLAAGKFLTDPIWWIYLFWVPDFLQRQHGLDLKSFGLPIAVIYIIADAGSVGGGWISSWMIKKGYTVNRCGKTAMLICALAVIRSLSHHSRQAFGSASFSSVSLQRPIRASRRTSLR
jgi:ACS family hexuronate transporter-like MFS transporter